MRRRIRRAEKNEESPIGLPRCGAFGTARLPDAYARLLSPRNSRMSRSRGWLRQGINTALGRRDPFVLCYHGVGEPSVGRDPHGLFVGRELFTRHLEVIKARGYQLVTVSDLWGLIHSSSSSVGCVGSISFDDGLAKTAREAVPILHERGIPCTMYIATGLIGRPHPDIPSEMIVSRSEVVELAAAGIEIGAHSVDHRLLTHLPYEDLLDQLRRSRATLEDLIGKPVTTMAYPFGAFNEQTIDAAREAGYELACGCSGPAQWAPLSIPREPIFPSTTRLRLTLKISGLYGPLYAVRRLVPRRAVRSRE